MAVGPVATDGFDVLTGRTGDALFAVTRFASSRGIALLFHFDGGRWIDDQLGLLALTQASTDAEWLRSCRGDADRTYPYGRDREPGACNDARARHPAVELFPGDPNPFARLQDACLNRLADGLAPTGAHPACVTPEGAFDLMGNLHEWTADPDGTFRGGFYVDTAINGAGCLYRTIAHNIDHWDCSAGFRCCAD